MTAQGRVNSFVGMLTQTARENYLASSAPKRVRLPNAMSRAVEILFPPLSEYAGRRKTLLALISRGTSWSTIRHWTSGRRKAPAWVRAIVADKLRRKAAELNHIAELLEP